MYRGGCTEPNYTKEYNLRTHPNLPHKRLLTLFRRSICITSTMANTPRDLTIGLLGTEVPRNSPTIVWKNGYRTVLPAVYDDHNINVCSRVDIPIIKYLAESPESSPSSIHTVHVLNRGDQKLDLHDLANDALSQSKPVVIRGGGRYVASEGLTLDFLDKSYGISPGRAVWVHGA